MAESGWLLDTSILIDVVRGNTIARNWVDSLPPAFRFISVVTAAELLAGCHNQREQRAIEREIDLYSVLALSEESSRLALDFYKQFHLSHGVGFLDCLIASCALTHGLPIATLNLKHFSILPRVNVRRPY